LFWKRYVSAFLTNPVNPSYDWYDPLETVTGAYALPLAKASAKTLFREDALAEAARYAEAHRSDSLIVLHAGHGSARGHESAPGRRCIQREVTRVACGSSVKKLEGRAGALHRAPPGVIES